MILAGFLTRVLFSRGTMKGKGTQRVMTVSGIARNHSWSCKWWEQGRCLYPGKMQRNAPPLHYLLALLSFSTSSTASWLWGIWKWILLQWKARHGQSLRQKHCCNSWCQPLLGPSILRVTAALIWLPGRKDRVCGLKQVRELQPHPWPGWGGLGIRAMACPVEPVCLQSR